MPSRHDLNDYVLLASIPTLVTTGLLISAARIAHHHLRRLTTR